MQKIFLDFDNTLVESDKRIIEILNKRYNLNKTENDLTDCYYTSIYNKVTEEEIEDIFASEEFFDGLEFKPFAYDMFNKYKDKYEIVITTKGSWYNLELKESWIRNHLDSEVSFLGLSGDAHDKSSVNMKNGIQIDDNSNCLRTNAGIKILYKDNHNYPWQRKYINKNILLVDSWEQIDEILEFYSKYDNKTLDRK